MVNLQKNKADNCAYHNIDKSIDDITLMDFMSDKLKQEMETFCKKECGFDTLDNEKLISIWPKIIGPKFFSDSVIPIARQTEIVKVLIPKTKEFLKKKNKMLIRNGIKWAEMDEETRKKLLEREAWFSLGTTHSKKEYRLGLGLKTSGCQYWKDNKVRMGCLNCGYFAAVPIGVKISSQQIVKQFNHALNSVNSEYNIDYDVIEFLNDGSFFNDEEVSSETREKIFKIISKKSNINRVLVESRPEYIDINEIKKLLKILRKNQELEIGIGLETTDRFISNFSINKGYEKEDFAKLVLSLNKLKRCKILSYCLVKPAFVSDKEAIEDVVRTIEYLHKFSRKSKIETIPKLEPVVVAKGTLLEVLNSEDKNDASYYKPPSYWTIAEIIATLVDKKLAHNVRIGAREDMDLFKAVPCIEYDIGMLSRIDFLVYGAVQEFNKHKNIIRLLADIGPAFKDVSFEEWIEANKIQKPNLMKLYEKHIKDIKIIQKKEKYSKRNEFLEKLFNCLDEIEYGEKTQLLANAGKIIELDEFIKSIITKNLENVSIKISSQELLESGLKLLRMNLNIYSKEMNEKHSIWIGIPTTRRVELKEVEHKSE